MRIPTEVDDLEHEIVRLQQEVGKKCAKVVTLRSKIESAQKNLDYCQNLRAMCLDNLKRMKGEQVIVMQEWRDMRMLHRSNTELVTKHRNDMTEKRRELAAVEEEIPFYRSLLAMAKHQLSTWNVVLPFKV